MGICVTYFSLIWIHTYFYTVIMYKHKLLLQTSLQGKVTMTKVSSHSNRNFWRGKRNKKGFEAVSWWWGWWLTQLQSTFAAFDLSQPQFSPALLTRPKALALLLAADCYQ